MTPTSDAICRLRNLDTGPGYPCRVMAILNASPESFYSGSVATGRDSIARAAEQAAAAGADILDIGAMSTAPYKETQISETEEADRMGEAVAAARSAADLPITADTQRSAVAKVALEAGADAINDVSGLRQDPAMAELAARVGAPLIVMAGEREGETAMSVTPPEIALAKLRRSMKAAAEAGVPHENLIVDPGVGFFRNQTLPWYEFDRELLRGLGELQVLNRPILVSASRKSFIGRVLDRKDAKDRLAGSLAIAAWCARLGANIIRTHDPAETRDVLRMGEWLEG